MTSLSPHLPFHAFEINLSFKTIDIYSLSSVNENILFSMGMKPFSQVDACFMLEDHNQLIQFYVIQWYSWNQLQDQT